MGNILFVVSSAYFLQGRPTSKKKAINILLDSQFISIGIFLGFIVAATVAHAKFHFSFSEAMQSIFPDLYEAVWFVPCYVIFYLIHPALDLVIENLTQKQHAELAALVFVFYGVLGLLKVQPAYSSLLAFIFIYFLIAYAKKYESSYFLNSRNNLISFLFFGVLFIVIVLLKNALSRRFAFFMEYPVVDGMLSVILLPMLVSLFFLFLKMEFRNRIVSFIASCSLFFYCIHENKIVREELRPMYYRFLMERYGEAHLLLYVVALIALVFVFGFIAAIIYKETIARITSVLSAVVEKLLKAGFDRLYVRRYPDGDREI